ncbi:MAG: hypothetical protein HY402_03830 [Elusimicrobia bacterium]|nr:hypothetical protein [Elusimicrobiota bacterium]
MPFLEQSGTMCVMEKFLSRFWKVLVAGLLLQASGARAEGPGDFSLGFEERVLQAVPQWRQEAQGLVREERKGPIIIIPQAQGPAAAELDAETVLARTLEALGGEKILTRKNLIRRGMLLCHSPGMHLPCGYVADYIEWPARERVEVHRQGKDFQGWLKKEEDRRYSEVIILDGERAWELSGLNNELLRGTYTVTGEDLRGLQEGFFWHEPATLVRFLLREDEELPLFAGGPVVEYKGVVVFGEMGNETVVYRLDVTARLRSPQKGEEPVKELQFYVNAQTFLPHAVVYSVVKTPKEEMGLPNPTVMRGEGRCTYDYGSRMDPRTPVYVTCWQKLREKEGQLEAEFRKTLTFALEQGEEKNDPDKVFAGSDVPLPEGLFDPDALQKGDLYKKSEKARKKKAEKDQKEKEEERKK